MALTYQSFKTYILAALWRQNDTDLTNNLDTIIRKANNELDRKTRDFQRRQKVTVIAPTSVDYDLTTNVPDFQAVSSLTSNNAAHRNPTMSLVTAQELYSHRTADQNGIFRPVYHVDRDGGTLMLRLAGTFSVENPGSFTLSYRVGVPDYAVTDASWLEDEYFDLYEYTIFKHCAVFLREDERLQSYASLQAEALASADQDDKHNLQFGGSPLYMKPHRYVP